MKAGDLETCLSDENREMKCLAGFFILT